MLRCFPDIERGSKENLGSDIKTRERTFELTSGWQEKVSNLGEPGLAEMYSSEQSPLKNQTRTTQ